MRGKSPTIVRRRLFACFENKQNILVSVKVEWRASRLATGANMTHVKLFIFKDRNKRLVHRIWKKKQPLKKKTKKTKSRAIHTSHTKVEKIAGQASTAAAPLRTRHLGALWRAFGNPFYADELPAFLNASSRGKAPLHVFYAQDYHTGRVCEMCTHCVARLSHLNSRSFLWRAEAVIYAPRICGTVLKTQAKYFNQPRLAHAVRAIKYYKSMSTSAPR